MAICKLCGKETDSLYHQMEQTVLEMIQRDHPKWIAADGSCQRCIEYYRSLDGAIRMKNDPAKR